MAGVSLNERWFTTVLSFLPIATALIMNPTRRHWAWMGGLYKYFYGLSCKGMAEHSEAFSHH